MATVGARGAPMAGPEGPERGGDAARSVAEAAERPQGVLEPRQLRKAIKLLKACLFKRTPVFFKSSSKLPEVGWGGPQPPGAADIQKSSSASEPLQTPRRHFTGGEGFWRSFGAAFSSTKLHGAVPEPLSPFQRPLGEVLNHSEELMAITERF